MGCRWMPSANREFGPSSNSCPGPRQIGKRELRPGSFAKLRRRPFAAGGFDHIGCPAGRMPPQAHFPVFRWEGLATLTADTDATTAVHPEPPASFPWPFAVGSSAHTPRLPFLMAASPPFPPEARLPCVQSRCEHRSAMTCMAVPFGHSGHCLHEFSPTVALQISSGAGSSPLLKVGPSPLPGYVRWRKWVMIDRARWMSRSPIPIPGAHAGGQCRVVREWTSATRRKSGPLRGRMTGWP